MKTEQQASEAVSTGQPSTVPTEEPPFDPDFFRYMPRSSLNRSGSEPTVMIFSKGRTVPTAGNGDVPALVCTAPQVSSQGTVLGDDRQELLIPWTEHNPDEIRAKDKWRSSSLTYPDFASFVKEYLRHVKQEQGIPECEETEACWDALRVAAGRGGQLTATDLSVLKRLEELGS